MGWVAPVIGGGLSLIGSLLGGHKQTTQGTTSSTPTTAPEYAGLRDMLIGQYTNALKGPSPFGAGYQAHGVGQINSAYDNALAGAKAGIQSRNLGPAAEGVAGVRNSVGRAGSIGDFLSQIPLHEFEARNQLLGGASHLLGFGSGTSGTSSGTGTANAGLGQGVDEIATLLGMLYGSGHLGGGGTATTGQPPSGEALASL